MSPYSSDRDYKQAVKFFNKAQTDWDKGKLTNAIQFFIKTADELADVGTPEADELRRQVAQLIRQVEQQLQ